MENKIIIGNMKMYMNLSEIEYYLKIIKDKVSDNVIFFPSSIYIPYFLKGQYHVGLQNISFFDDGAYTGEISAHQATEMKIQYAMLGHSERRLYFKETDYEVNQKVIKCLNNNLNIIICIGETKEEKLQSLTKEVIKNQLMIALNNVEIQKQKNIIIAYEPRWAIGTNQIPTIFELEDVVDYIKKILKKDFKMNLKVIYGGSVNIDNIAELNRINNIDGFLLGRSCIEPQAFLKIIEVINLKDI